MEVMFLPLIRSDSHPTYKSNIFFKLPFTVGCEHILAEVFLSFKTIIPDSKQRRNF